jgi:hypothetical protein
MNTAVRIGAILILALMSTGVDHAAGNKSLIKAKNTDKTKTKIIGGEGDSKLSDEQEDFWLFPLENAILNRL